MFACVRRLGKLGIEESAIRIKAQGGIEGYFTIIVCRACPDPPCAKVCPTKALVPREGGGVILNKEKCVKCGACAQACIIRAISFDKEGYPVICIHCGYCVQYCPHGILSLVEVGEVIH